MVLGEHAVIAEIDTMNHDAARLEATRHIVECREQVIEMLHHRPAEDGVELEAAIAEERLRRLPGVISESPGHLLGGRAGE